MFFLADLKDVLDKFHLTFHEMLRVHKTLFFSLKNDDTTFQGQGLVLLVLIKKNGCTQKELAKILSIKPGSLTDILQRMEKAEMIERKTDEKDLRITRVFYTDKGFKQVEKVKAISKLLSDISLKGFSEKEKEEFINYMERAIYNMNSELDSSEKTDERGISCDKIN